MIKRLVWTIILLSPAVIAGFIAILNGDSGAASALNLFNAGSAMNYTWESLKDFIDLFNEESRNILGFIWNVILAAFFIAPFIFVWRGMFFIEWIPVVGHAIRAVAIAFLIFIPGLFQILVNGGNDYSNFIEQSGVYLETAVLVLAMVGLWLPKGMTTRRRKK